MARLSTSLIVLASCLNVFAASAPPGAAFSIPVSRKKLAVTDMKDFVSRERARAHSFAHTSKDATGASATGPAINEDVSYVAVVTVGSQEFDLIVDTGSSNTWVGAGTKLVDGTTAKSTGREVEVTYGSGSFEGTEFTDTVTFAGLTVTEQSIGVASESEGFEGVDGIIGFGPVDLTEDTVADTATVPTFLDNLKSQGTISTEILGVSFAPEDGSDTDDQNGELDLGATDSSKFTGSLAFSPRTTTSPFNEFWGVNVASIKFGSTTVGGAAAAIVDTGTTLIFIPTSAYDAFLTAAGGTTDEEEGLATFRTTPTSDFSFVIGSSTFSLTPEQFIIPQAQNSAIGLPEGQIFSWIADGGSEAADINFIIGQKFLENFYAAFDTTNNQIGFAPRA